MPKLENQSGKLKRNINLLSWDLRSCNMQKKKNQNSQFWYSTSWKPAIQCTLKFKATNFFHFFSKTENFTGVVILEKVEWLLDSWQKSQLWCRVDYPPKPYFQLLIITGFCIRVYKYETWPKYTLLHTTVGVWVSIKMNVITFDPLHQLLRQSLLITSATCKMPFPNFPHFISYSFVD